MTQIKKITDRQGNDIYLRTHTKAVVDDNGYTAESRLQAMQDEINQTQLEVGAVSSDLTPTENSTNWVTSGGIYNQLYVRTDETQILSVTPTKNKVSTYADTISIGNKYTITFSNVSENSSATISVGNTSSESEKFIEGNITEGQTLDITSTVNATHWRMWRPTGSSYKVTIVRKDVVMVKDMMQNIDVTPNHSSPELITSGGVYDALPKNTNTLFENTLQTNWLTGNISGGSIVTTYSNRYLVVELPDDIGIVDIESEASTFTLVIEVSNNSSSGYVWKATRNANQSLTTSINLSGYKYLCMLLYDKPSTVQAQQEVIKITYKTIFEGIDVTNDFFESNETIAAGASLTNVLGTSLYIEKLITGNGITWIQGGINGSTGYLESNGNAICTQPIYLLGDTQATVYKGILTGETGMIAVYDESGTFKAFTSSLSTISYPNGYIRFVFYGGTAITPESGASSNAYVIRRIGLKGRLELLENKIIKTYSNPVLRIDFPDPTIWDGEDGYFYALATGSVTKRTMYRSANLIDWEDTGELPYTNEVAQTILSNFGSSTSYWAPHVYKVKEGQWNLYLTKPSGGIAFLTSKYPTYGYEFVKFTTAPFGNYIDPDVARDRDGSLWMFAGSAAMMHRRQMTDDGLDFAEGSEWVHVAGRPSGESGNTNRIKTFEGEYLYRHKGYWYLFCSSGGYGGSTYALRVIRSATLDGTFVDKEGNLATDGYAETLLSSGGELYGPGHNAPIFVDSDGKTWILYHSHWTGMSSSAARSMCLDEVLWDEDGWPYFSGGTPSLSHVAPSVIR